MDLYMKNLRDAQYEYNRLQTEIGKNMCAILRAQYGGSEPIRIRRSTMPEFKWVICPQELEDYKKKKTEERFEDVYRDASVAWDNFFSDRDGDYTKFGSAPIRDCYWKMEPVTGQYIWKEKVIPRQKAYRASKKRELCRKVITPPEILQYFDPVLLSKPNPTMVFRRYPNLDPMMRPYEMDVLLCAFLGIPQVLGVKINSKHAILNDSWTVNLKTCRENIMMDSFLKGFGTEFEDMKKQWCDTQPHTERPQINMLMGERQMGIDVSEELKDLFKVYTDANAHLESKEKNALNHLVNAMESFLAVHKEKIKVANKLANLQYKFNNSGCGCEQDEDEDDDE